ncbi:DMT family transporter [Spirilliplanes yamanashiensis]|uniref:Membrane protein n=1 Tax=Spirilliplanes yamanashiensis TaxID=42233 RepID=A0A8J4DIE3_9ACTN|nr:DMT family transporter [Spirilliplanes yamanashiensis]MDP9814626.1 drug/metabolite transporter (DMT)-like permease [Spirilliplanes yamanashiensis]GIJ02279.1 membrane protein [Spirilliplanes yamanashiensis]
MRRHLFALIAAGLLWGSTVPLTKVALAGWGPGWLTVARFTLAALPLAWLARHRLRAAVTPAIIGWGVLGYGLVIVLQNAGIERTSVTHAALLVGATPILVALLTVATGRATVRPTAWAGFATALAGVAFVASHGGSGATLTGDALVILSLVLSAAFLVAQPRMLTGRDPVAVTAVQLTAAAVGAVPAAALLDGPAPAAPGAIPLLAMLGLAVGGTLLPFTLFAYAQSRVSPDVAGAFLNLEPLVGVLAAAAVFGEALGVAQVAGGVAILAGIALSTAAAFLRPARPRRLELAG